MDRVAATIDPLDICEVFERAGGKPTVPVLEALWEAFGDRTALVLEHDEAVRLRHRAQHARALLAGGAHFPFAVFAEEDAALVPVSYTHLPLPTTSRV